MIDRPQNRFSANSRPSPYEPVNDTAQQRRSHSAWPNLWTALGGGLTAAMLVAARATGAAAQNTTQVPPCSKVALLAAGLPSRPCGVPAGGAAPRPTGPRPTGGNITKLIAQAGLPVAEREHIPVSVDGIDGAAPRALLIPDVSDPFAEQVEAGLTDVDLTFTPRDEPDELEAYFAAGKPTAPEHVAQGFFVGDCSLDAALIAIAARNASYLPARVRRLGTSAGHNALAVQLHYFTETAWVRVDEQILQSPNRNWIGNWPQPTPAGKNIMWPLLFEKVVATLANAYPDATQSYSFESGYQTISGTQPGDLLRILTGARPSYSDYLGDLSSAEVLAAAAPVTAGGLGTIVTANGLSDLDGYAFTDVVTTQRNTTVTMTTISTGNVVFSAKLASGKIFYIVPNHTYALLGVFPATQELLIRNPWGEGYTEPTPAQFRIPIGLAQDLFPYMVTTDTLPEVEDVTGGPEALDEASLASLLAPGPSTEDSDVFSPLAALAPEPATLATGGEGEPPVGDAGQPPEDGVAAADAPDASEPAPGPAFNPPPPSGAGQWATRLGANRAVYGAAAAGCTLGLVGWTL